MVKSTLKAKRPAQPVAGPSKKRKIENGKPKKSQAADRGIIPIPVADDDVELSDQDMDVLETYGGATTFLAGLDHKGIARSKKETDRLYQLNKPTRKARVDDDLPSLDSHSDDDEFWDSDDDALTLSDSDSESLNSPRDGGLEAESDEEMPYELLPRTLRPSVHTSQPHPVERLPIKLADGRIQKTGNKITALPTPDPSDTDSDVEVEVAEEPAFQRQEDVSTGARFGRLAVVDVIGNKSRKARIEGAKAQIASICSDIVAEPETNLGLLRRLHSFSLARLATPSHSEPVVNDVIIRKLAMLSQLAVFKDIIPGYRIRALTDKEKEEKVSQMVARTREWEQGLVTVYQTYLRSLEVELKGKTALAEVALQCICTLAVEVIHFNFQANLLSCIVARLSKKSWDSSSDLCLDTLAKILRADLTGSGSLEIVRLINRTIKEKRFNVHPNVLSCLLHLRLKTELGIRASEFQADKDGKPLHSKGKAAARRAKGKATDQPHLSKKTRKALKEKKEIDREFKDAEAEVDKEERAVTQTETLKLLFVLYFRILKNPHPTPLLPAALQGISKYAHMVNIDFFKDLLKVLKDLISLETSNSEEEELAELTTDAKHVRHRLLCIVTAFELLSGQGEALNIDLTDFINHLYAIILPLALMPDIETVTTSSLKPSLHTQPIADMLFRALNIVFSPRTFGSAAPPWRSAAFAKRLLSASLHWPPASALRALDFVGGLVAKDPKLEALLGTEDRTYNGAYRPDIDDPQLCLPFGTSFHELHLLARQHWDARVKEEAGKLIRFTRS